MTRIEFTPLCFEQLRIMIDDWRRGHEDYARRHPVRQRPPWPSDSGRPGYECREDHHRWMYADGEFCHVEFRENKAIVRGTFIPPRVQRILNAAIPDDDSWLDREGRLVATTGFIVS